MKTFNVTPSYAINFEREKFYKNEPKFNGVYLRNNLSKVRHKAYIINPHEY